MKDEIAIREAVTKADVALFWEQLHAYHRRDIFPDPEDNEAAYFLDDTQYRAQVQSVHDRPQDRGFYLFFHRAGQDIGFALPVIFTSEDGKCFIMEFCVFPAFRGGGTGTECAGALLDWAKRNGAQYAVLNCGSHPRRRRFWERVGFVANGADEWGEPLMILPPTEHVPYTVEALADAEDWQLKKLENGYLQEIGESPLTKEKQERLAAAVRDGRITFFLARRGYRAVGMCSVVKCFSTFACTDTGIFEDFYVEPAFRKQGIARKLARAAQAWSREQGLASLTVCSAPCDEKMYQSLGFETPLGAVFADINAPA